MNFKDKAINTVKNLKIKDKVLSTINKIKSKDRVLLAGLFCEFLACLRIPTIGYIQAIGSSRTVRAWEDYEWLWTTRYNAGNGFERWGKFIIDYEIVIIDVDIPRLIITMVAIAIFTAMLYLVVKSRESK